MFLYYFDPTTELLFYVIMLMVCITLQGLDICVQEMMPGCERRIYVKHLQQNFKKKFGGGTMMKDLMMGASKATYEVAWVEKMKQIKAVNQEAYQWLCNLPMNSWCI